MKKFSILLLFVFILIACTGKAKPADIFGVYPGMTCPEFTKLFEGQKVDFSKKGDNYIFSFRDDIWDKADVNCSEVVREITFVSKSGIDPVYSQRYEDIKRYLLDKFRDNKIVYEEGSRIIDFGNGVTLQFFADSGKGVVKGYKVTVRDTEGARKNWEIVLEYLNKEP